MSLAMMPDDDLGLIVERVPEEDRLPLALGCKRLSAICIAARGGESMYRWQTKATSTAARAKWAIQHMGATPTVAWCATLARRGDDVLLVYLSSRYCVPLDATVCAGAAAGGHVELLHHLHCERSVPWDESACYMAAFHGQLHMLQWLREREAPLREFAIKDGLPWYVETGTHPSVGAIIGGHLHVLEWMESVGLPVHYVCPGDDELEMNYDIDTCLTHAAYNGHVDVLQWLYQRMPPWLASNPRLEESASMVAAQNGNIDVLKWMRSKGVQFTAQIWYSALWANPTVEMLDWLLAQGTPLDWSHCANPYEMAVNAGPIDVVKWLHSHGCPLEPDDGKMRVCAAAARDDEIEMLRYVHYELGAPWDKAECIAQAEYQENTAMVEWIRAQP